MGPSLGGVRFWHYDDDEAALRDALRLSEAMTLKAAMAVPELLRDRVRASVVGFLWLSDDGRVGDAQFNRSQAYNRGAWFVDADVVVFAEADMMVPYSQRWRLLATFNGGFTYDFAPGWQFFASASQTDQEGRTREPHDRQLVTLKPTNSVATESSSPAVTMVFFNTSNTAAVSWSPSPIAIACV